MFAVEQSVFIFHAFAKYAAWNKRRWKFCKKKSFVNEGVSNNQMQHTGKFPNDKLSIAIE
jgi:hypothetical protein